jgi:hypothetical protein
MQFHYRLLVHQMSSKYYVTYNGSNLTVLMDYQMIIKLYKI